MTPAQLCWVPNNAVSTQTGHKWQLWPVLSWGITATSRAWCIWTQLPLASLVLPLQSRISFKLEQWIHLELYLLFHLKTKRRPWAAENSTAEDKVTSSWPSHATRLWVLVPTGTFFTSALFLNYLSFHLIGLRKDKRGRGDREGKRERGKVGRKEQKKGLQQASLAVRLPTCSWVSEAPTWVLASDNVCT